MVRKNRRFTSGRHTALWGVAAAVCITAALWSQSFVSLADSTGTVIPGSVNIREKADGGSTVVGSASAGTTVNIKDEVHDSSGTLWYQVYVNANTTGYIRADLIDKKDGGTGAQASSSGGTDATGAAVEAESAMDPQYATVSIEAIKVRMAPSTSEGVVDRLVKDTQVVIKGQSNGSDGKLWYLAVFTGTDGSEKTGFIRSDLLTLGDVLPREEEPEQSEQPSEPEPEPEKTVNNDYELTYEEEDGVYEWYLYDYTDGEHGGRQKLKNLLEAAQSKQEGTDADAKTLVKQRIAIVVLAVLLVILTITVIVMAVKLRDAYYEDYDDDDEDDDDEEDEDDEPVSRRRRVPEEEAPAARRRRSAEEEAAPVRRRRIQEEEETQPERVPRKRPVRDDRRGAMREVTYQEDGAGSIAVSPSPKRKAKNFLLDDDDFEFEFLNMDDKDL